MKLFRLINFNIGCCEAEPISNKNYTFLRVDKANI
jgi:hypothetical protein